MTQKSAIFSTTYIDAHGEKMSFLDLEGMVKQINEGIISVDIEHDPRKVPIGRVISANIIDFKDGEFGVEGIIELFDCKVEELSDLGERRLNIRDFSKEGITICYDRYLNEPEIQKDIEELCVLLNTTNKHFEIKKSVEPITILTIAGSYILGGISTGFLESISSDAYDKIKKKILNISRKKSTDKKEYLQIFEFTIVNLSTKYNVQLILTNPSENDLDKVMTNFSKLDNILPFIFSKIPNARKLVFELIDGKLILDYILDDKGILINIENLSVHHE